MLLRVRSSLGQWRLDLPASSTLHDVKNHIESIYRLPVTSQTFSLDPGGRVPLNNLSVTFEHGQLIYLRGRVIKSLSGALQVIFDDDELIVSEPKHVPIMESGNTAKIRAPDRAKHERLVDSEPIGSSCEADAAIAYELQMAEADDDDDDGILPSAICRVTTTPSSTISQATVIAPYLTGDDAEDEALAEAMRLSILFAPEGLGQHACTEGPKQTCRLSAAPTEACLCGVADTEAALGSQVKLGDGDGGISLSLQTSLPRLPVRGPLQSIGMRDEHRAEARTVEDLMVRSRAEANATADYLLRIANMVSCPASLSSCQGSWPVSAPSPAALGVTLNPDPSPLLSAVGQLSQRSAPSWLGRRAPHLLREPEGVPSLEGAAAQNYMKPAGVVNALGRTQATDEEEAMLALAIAASLDQTLAVSGQGGCFSERREIGVEARPQLKLPHLNL